MCAKFFSRLDERGQGVVGGFGAECGGRERQGKEKKFTQPRQNLHLAASPLLKDREEVMENVVHS